MFFCDIRDWRASAIQTLAGGVLLLTLTGCDAAIGEADNESAATMSVVSSSSAPNFGKWQVEKSVDPLSDEVEVGIALPAEEGEVIFGLLCSDKSPAVIVIWQNYLSGEEIGGDKYQSIIYRVGNAQPVNGGVKTGHGAEQKSATMAPA